jgi:iron complex outermembrane receptor protein
MSSFKGMLFATAAAAQLLAVAPAMAQDAPADTAEDDNVIIVTATKRAQNIQDIPAAIAAVSGDALTQRGITDPSDLQFLTPSLQVGKSQGNTAFTIRGVGFNTVGSPAVAVHVDGVFQPRAGMGDLAQIDVDRVEILRGPQGTLYGRNANGGVVNFLSTRPTDEWEGQFKARYASFDEIYLEGILNIPFGNSSGGARFVVAHNDQKDGFVKNVGGGPDLLDEGFTAARMALDFDVSESLKVQLTGSYVERDGAIFTSIAQGRPRTTGVRGAPFGDLFAFGGNLYAALGAVWSAAPNTTTANDPSSSDRKAVNFSGVIDWDIGDFKLRSITGYQDFSEDHRADFDGTNVTIYQGRIIRDSETFTQEFNLSGKVGPVDIIVGGFYLDENYSQDLSITQPNGNGSFLPNAKLSFITPYYKTKAVAAFTDVTVNLADNLRVSGGLRYSKDKQNTFQDFRILANIRVAPTVVISPGIQCNAALPELKFNSTTPRVGLQFDASSNTTLYGNYSEGFKVGGYNTDGTCNDAYEPEEIKSYEAGVKNTLLDGDLTLNATGFFYKYKNLQVQQIIGTGVSIINAPKAEIKGLELEASWKASKSFGAFASVALLDAKYTQFVNPDGAQGPTPIDVSGNRLSHSPKVSINAGIDVTPDIDILGGSINLRTDGSYRSESFVREFNNPTFERNDPYFIANASLTWTNASEKFLVRGFVTNLFDEVYLTQSQWSAPIQTRTVSYNQPRQYGLEMQVKF